MFGMIKGFNKFFESNFNKDYSDISDILIVLEDLGFEVDIKRYVHGDGRWWCKCNGSKKINGDGTLSTMEKSIGIVKECSTEYIDCLHRLEAMGWKITYTLLESSYHMDFTRIGFNLDIERKEVVK